MIRKITLIFCLSLILINAWSQKESPEFKKLFSEATLHLYNENYSEAIATLKKLDKLDPDNANLHFQLGYCYLHSPKDPKKAIYHLEKASADISKSYEEAFYKEDNAPVETFKYLADAYHLNYQFETAIAMYERFIKELDPSAVEQINEVRDLIGQCETAKSVKKFPLNMTVANIGGKINSQYADYNPCVNADESVMIFTSKREGSTGGKSPIDGNYYEDIYFSSKVNGQWTKPLSIGAEINTEGHESSINVSADGQTLLLYKYDSPQGGGDIYISRLNGQIWSIPQKMGSNINSESWEGSASISPDGQYLYFSSDRPGGFGGKDIYFCKKLPNGDWGLAQNCGPQLNTSKDEDAPYIHPDGVTLFFSSKGHKSMGGYDIFFVERIEDKKWSEVTNIGYPVNTPGDDIHFKPTADRRRAYYSSYRSDGFGDQDIYMITFPEIKVTPLTVFKGFVKDEAGEVPIDLVINVMDAKTNELIGNYVPNSKTGKYIIILNPGRLYNIEYETADGVLYSEQFDVPEGSSYQEIDRAINLPPLKIKR